MVDLRMRLPLGSISGRNIFKFAASMLVAVFVLFFAISPTAHAADATWQGSAISYAQKQFIKTADAAANDPRNLPKGTQIYAYVEPAPAGSTNPSQKAHLLYFPPGSDVTKATTATYITYDYTPPDTYANPSPTTQVTLDPQTGASNTGTTSCALEGIGWIICPAANFLAGAMDKIFEILASFMTVRPMQTTQDSALFRMWSVMRNFANVAFVIAFLIIIYSQVTGFGISSYGIKRLLPRLIAAAILVNISYWVCAIAIDISNISGHSLQQLFINLRNALVGTEGNNWENLGSWQSWTGFIISGGTAAVAASIGIHSLLAGSVTGSIMLLLPILVIVLTSALVALLIMALRQAFITILVILSPLAFVAYLLPNTEKYFEKWRDLFMTMLLMFPIISVIFGGAQLAGMAIIQNANSINMIILGMAVQVAPLIVTPLLIKFSGALLARFGGVLNNPNKGLIDKTRNWAKDRAENQKAHVLANTPARGLRGAAARRTHAIDAKRRKREGWRNANQAIADANWTNTQAYSDIEQAAQRANLVKQRGETAAQARFEAAKSTNADLQQLDIDARAAKLRLDVSQARTEANWEELKTGDARSMAVPDNMPVSALANYAHTRQAQARSILEETVNAAVEARRAHSAKEHGQSHFADTLLNSAELQRRAGGVAGQLGADAAIADAIKSNRKAYGEATEDASELVKHFNISGEDRQKLAMGETIIVTDPHTKQTREFNVNSTYMREAVIDAQLSGQGSYSDIEKIIMNSGGSLSQFKTSIGDAIPKYKIAEKAAYLSGVTIDEVKQGVIKDEATLNAAVAKTIGKGKVKAAQLATMDPDAVKRLLTVAQNPQAAITTIRQLEPDRRKSDPVVNAFMENISSLGVAAQQALKNENISGSVSKKTKGILQEMVRTWPPSTDDDA
ncbi:MAG TPA: hypothetical protein VFT59_00940 [Candidatus Saccharimonadales bacterium]|nr:hypothetical protein [Candidatus Saccharimonadales bacterium]